LEGMRTSTVGSRGLGGHVGFSIEGAELALLAWGLRSSHGAAQ
jgi:hypothetical protein